MNRIQRQVLERYSPRLTEAIIVDEKLLRWCESHRFIVPNMTTDIMAGGNNAEKLKKLLDHLEGHRGPNSFDSFVFLLRENGHEWLASRLADAHVIARATGTMSPDKTANLQKFIHKITIIILDQIWNRVDHIFSTEEEIQVKAASADDKENYLLDILSRKSDVAFNHLVQALQRDHRKLADQLMQGIQVEERGHESLDVQTMSSSLNKYCEAMTQAIELELPLCKIMFAGYSSSDENEEIKIQKEEKQIEKLLDILSNKSDLAFDHLVKALLPHHGMLAGRKVSGMQ